MYRSVHIFVGFSFGLLVAGSNPSAIFYGIAGALGGWFPDIDLIYKHRKLFHNIFLLSIISTLIFFTLCYYVNIPYVEPRRLTLSFTGGWVFHLLFDSFTKRGVYILWPLSKARLRIPIFRSDSILGNFIAVLFGLFLLYMWFKENGLIVLIDKIIFFF